MTPLNLFPLSEEWTPPKLLIRDRQLTQLFNNYNSPIKENFWISGQRGLGKTLTAKIFSKMTSNTFILECTNPSFKKNVMNFAMRHGIKPKAFDSVISLILEPMIERLSSEGKVTLFIDDIDRLGGGIVKRDFSTYLASLYDQLLSITDQFSIHIISTKPITFAEKSLSDWCMSRLKFKSLFFPRYSKNEIKQLLQQRLQYIDGLKVDDEAVDFIAEKISRIGGDFRKALEMTKTAIIETGKLDKRGVEKAWKKEKIGFWRNQIFDTPYHAALLLGCVVEETVKQHGELKGEPPYFPVAWSHIKNRYRRKCMKFGIEPQNQKMLYYWLEQLWLKGWIDKFTLSKKHEWNYTGKRELYIRILEKLENLVPAMKEIDWSEPW